MDGFGFVKDAGCRLTECAPGMLRAWSGIRIVCIICVVKYIGITAWLNASPRRQVDIQMIRSASGSVKHCGRS